MLVADGVSPLMCIAPARTPNTVHARHEAWCCMKSYDHAPSRIVRRPSAVSASLLSTPALDVDLHVALTRPAAHIVMATIFVRVSFWEERVAVDVLVAEGQMGPGADASALAAAQALALRRTPAACREFVRQAMTVAMGFCRN
jgi:hypothetical protein